MTSTCDVLVVAAHPDDGEMGMGGTMIKFVKAGYKVFHLVLTKSEMSTHGDVKTREREFADACKIIGCQGRQLDFLDTGIENNRDSRIKLAKIIRELKPKIIFAPYHTNPIGEMRGLAHVDHYTTGALTRDAVKMARLAQTIPEMPPHNIHKLYFYMVPKAVRGFLYVDVSDVIDQVMESISAYKTQMAITFKDVDIKHTLMTRRAYAGTEIGTKYAEYFATDLPLVMSAKDFVEL